MTTGKTDTPGDRVHMIWPTGLKGQVEEITGRRGVTKFTVAAVERALQPRCPKCDTLLVDGECWTCP